MAQLHEHLYRSNDFASVDAAEYLKSIARELSMGYAWPDISCTAASVAIGIDEALPLGLIAGELLISALKYAYARGERGPLRLALTREDQSLCLRVEDEGRGLAPGIEPATCSSMGFTIVRGLASQLRAELSFGGPPGFWAEMRMPFAGAG
jgi:two-component sensor histidine kinase